MAFDFDEEDFEPQRKKPANDIAIKLDLLAEKQDILNEEFAIVKDNITDIMQLTSESKIPLSLKKLICDHFKCSLCHSTPINPPIIVSKCCKTIIGCEGCVNTWFSGSDALTKSCPICRAKRGYNEMMILKGIDDFLHGVRRITSIDDDELPPPINPQTSSTRT